jgi:hypothetical protein
MTEKDWQAGSNGDDLLDPVADHLTPRQWVLLAAAYVRRLWDVLPDGPLRDAVDAAERAAGEMTQKDRDGWTARVLQFTAQAVAAAETAQHEIVKSCDPDAADLTAPVLDKPNREAPAFSLFRAASGHARTAIGFTGDAVRLTAAAVRGLFAEPGPGLFDEVRRQADQAAEMRADASRVTNLALRFKHEGDELADRAARSRFSAAVRPGVADVHGPRPGESGRRNPRVRPAAGAGRRAARRGLRRGGGAPAPAGH